MKFTKDQINKVIEMIDPVSGVPPKKAYQSFTNSYERRLNSYQPSDGKSHGTNQGIYRKDYFTWCNYFVQDVSHALGLIDDVDYPRTDTNCAKAISWYSSSKLWKETTALEAQQNANLGMFVVGCTSSHMVVIVAEDSQWKMKNGIYPVCSQAGSKPRLRGYFEASGVRYWTYIGSEKDIPPIPQALKKTIVDVSGVRYTKSSSELYRNIDLVTSDPLEVILNIDHGKALYIFDKINFSNGVSWAMGAYNESIGFIDPNRLTLSPPDLQPITIKPTSVSSKSSSSLENDSDVNIKSPQGIIHIDKYGSPLDGTAIGSLSHGGGSSSAYYLNVIDQTYSCIGEALWNQYKILPSIVLIVGILESSLIPYGGWRLIEPNKLSSQIESSNNCMGLVHRQKSSGGADMMYMDRPTLCRIPNAEMKSGYSSQVYAFSSINECFGYFAHTITSHKYQNVVNRLDVPNIFKEIIPTYSGKSNEDSMRYIDMAKRLYGMSKYAFLKRDMELAKRLGIV